MKSKWWFLWGAAAVLLLLNLGVGDAANSESRWLAVVAEMLRSGDWLRPTINAQPYYDKPLGSYWGIAIVSWLTGGVSEWSARLPTALAALLGLFSLVSLARRRFDAATAWASAWIMLTFYAFVFWGRLAEADMANLAFITAATAWYFYVRERPGFRGYLVFWLLCVVGAQMKGLAAFAVPLLLVGLDMLLTGTVLRHVRDWRAWAAWVIGGAVYVLPFMLGAVDANGYGGDGLTLVFRENIVRAVMPWDHKEDPWYIYFIYVPQLLLPWTLFFVFALAAAVRREAGRLRRKLGADADTWLLLSVVLIFVMFSMSQSRRVYYILPILPFAALLTGRFLAAARRDVWGRLTTVFSVCMAWVGGLGGVLLVLSPLVFHGLYPALTGSAAELTPGWFYAFFYVGIPGCGVAIVLFCVWWRRGALRRKLALTAYPALDLVIPVVALTMALIMGVLLPWLGHDPAFRSERTFCRESHRLMFEKYGIAAEKVAFVNGDYSNLVFYLNLPRPASLFGPRANDPERSGLMDDPLRVQDMAALRRRVAEMKKHGGALLARLDRAMWLEADLRAEFLRDAFTPAEGVYMEPFTLSEQAALRELAAASVTVEADRKRAKIVREKYLLKIYPPATERAH